MAFAQSQDRASACDRLWQSCTAEEIPANVCEAVVYPVCGRPPLVRIPAPTGAIWREIPTVVWVGAGVVAALLLLRR